MSMAPQPCPLCGQVKTSAAPALRDPERPYREKVRRMTRKISYVR